MKAAYTNNCYAGSVRGFGSPQIDFATESVMDELAQQLGMTPGPSGRKTCCGTATYPAPASPCAT